MKKIMIFLIMLCLIYSSLYADWIKTENPKVFQRQEIKKEEININDLQSQIDILEQTIKDIPKSLVYIGSDWRMQDAVREWNRMWVEEPSLDFTTQLKEKQDLLKCLKELP